MTGDNTCTALGITVTDNAPVLALCRALVAAGRNPETPLEVYRHGTLALRVRSIGKGASVEVNSKGIGFVPLRSVHTASPVRQNDHPLSPTPEAAQ